MISGLLIYDTNNNPKLNMNKINYKIAAIVCCGSFAFPLGAMQLHAAPSETASAFVQQAQKITANECWANVRRSGYPQLKSPADYGFAQYLMGGNEIPVRLCYPVLESSYNKLGYDEALCRMGGKDDWHTHVW